MFFQFDGIDGVTSQVVQATFWNVREHPRLCQKCVLDGMRGLPQKTGIPGSYAHPQVPNRVAKRLSAYPFHGGALLPQQCSAPSLAVFGVMPSFQI